MEGKTMRFEDETLNGVIGQIRRFYETHGVVGLKIETISKDPGREYEYGDGSLIGVNRSGATVLRLTAAGEMADVQVECDDVRGDYRAANPGRRLPPDLITYHCTVAAADWRRRP
jgi:hypothetical protein